MHVDRIVGLTIELEARPPDVIVHLGGELDDCNLAPVRALLDAACDTTTGDVLLACPRLDFLGVAGAVLFCRVDQRLTLEGRHLVVQEPSRAVSRARYSC